ncbi:MAG: DUF262 domain-containing protein [Bradyrhizobiaceae bacterium]|nr:MAG: DUF262 domain-containing protein [Bradyrhizobiaceae bacterium]
MADQEFELSDDDNLPLDQQEDIDDIETTDRWFHGATLWSTDWTTETLLAQLNRGNINLNPSYQRRSSWRPDRKSRFIESLILGLPIPQIILAEDKNKRGSFIVIDGKQRLLTLRQYCSEEGDKFDSLKLVGLEERQDLNSTNFSDLRSRAEFADDLIAFENQTIRTVVIRNWKNERYLYSVFLRINTGSLPLSPQELRQALQPGDFSTFVDTFSMNSKELQKALSLKAPDFRMRDAELVLRYFAYINFFQEYDGRFKEFLDLTSKRLNQRWEADRHLIEKQAKDLELALATVREIFGERGALRKWNGSEYERRVNRAVFDIMVYYFKDVEIRKKALKEKEAIEEAFRTLCEEDIEFLYSIERTTKSLDSNQIRFDAWGQALSAVCGVPVPRFTIQSSPRRILITG